jgi:DNA mismatch repair protein MutL
MQFFFINNRFIRNAYLHHAVTTAYEGLIEKEAFPFYVLFLETDPARVDVNVHPTKQEVKFDDDRMMYAYLNAAIKHSLARYNIAPSLDFSLNSEITSLSSVQLPNTNKEIESVEKGYLYNTFRQGNQAHVVERTDALKHWKDLYQIAQKPEGQAATSFSQDYSSAPSLHQKSNTAPETSHNVLLVQGSIMVTTVKSGLMIIHIRRAQERIWYERLLEGWNNNQIPSQRLLFPTSYELAPQDALLLTEVIADLARVGFDIAPFGKNTFVVQGIPTALPAGEEKNILDEVIDQLKHESPDAVSQRADRMVIQLARRLSLNKEAMLQPEGQQALIDELFACTQPEYTPNGKKVFTMVRKEALDDLLK